MKTIRAASAHRGLPWRLLAATCLTAILGRPCAGQLAPEIGYALPAGGQVGTSVEITLGGYDWTPDMQLLVHDPRVQVELLGPPTEVLVPPPPYWFGAKGRGPAWPLPREFRARLSIAPNAPPGLIRWQVANANGVSPPGVLHVDRVPELFEQRALDEPQPIAALPVIVSGRVAKIEEIDRYVLHVAQPGHVTIETFARRLNSPLHVMLQVRDPAGQTLVDVADTPGRDLAETFYAAAAGDYELRLHDLDFAGDFSYVYRLKITAGPRVVAAIPAAGLAGTTQSVTLHGWGVASGGPDWESVVREVAYPTTPGPFEYAWETPAGTAVCTLRSSELPEVVAGPSDGGTIGCPQAVTGTFDGPAEEDRYLLQVEQPVPLRIEGQAANPQAALDLAIRIRDAQGAELIAVDDEAGRLDAGLVWTPPAAGPYEIVVTDQSGAAAGPAAPYRLIVRPAPVELQVQLPTQASVLLGGTASLPVKVVRGPGCDGPVTLTFAGLPAGVAPQGELVLPAAAGPGLSELAVPLACAAESPASATLATVTATIQTAAGPVACTSMPFAVATIMAPRVKLTPEGLDDVRTWPRGSTFLAPVFVERLEGFAGEVVLEMTARQQRHRQGLRGDELLVPADVTRAEYPIFLPEWLETTKTSRMIINGVARVPDPSGNVRYLVSRMELRFGLLPKGALLKLVHEGELSPVPAGAVVEVPLHLSRVTSFSAPASLTLQATSPPLAGLTLEPLVFEAATDRAAARLQLPSGTPAGEYLVTLRATALQDGRWPVVTETEVRLRILSE